MKEVYGERGFSLVEVLVCSAIAAIAVTVLVSLAHHMVRTTQHLERRLQATSATQALLDRLQSDAASAWAVWVPATDVLGDDNGDGHEVDFFAEDGSYRRYAWAYRYDTASGVVTRYAYASGIAPSAGVTYQPLEAFVATSAAASAIADPSSALYDPLFSSVRVAAYDYDFGTAFGATGGNAITHVHITSTGNDGDALLSSATAPSHFTVVVTYTPSPAPLGTPTPTPLPIAPFVP
ncbi:MAG: prepilin-type N-terminal cleavage/methylation domain-containing protein [Vulcanimicrobiaceae bacterium]